MRLLVNTGSSTVKLALARGHRVVARTTLESEADEDALKCFLEANACPSDAILAVGHRVVHAGDFVRHVRIDTTVEESIIRATPYAPLHNPVALRWMIAVRRVLGRRIDEVALLDTAFFARLPDVAAAYGLPRSLSEELRLRRYGFHGLAHENMLRRLGSRVGRRVVTLQLGSGCSAAASLDGEALDVSMGFSPSEGLMMATRAGDLDSGLVLHLMREHGFSVERMDRLLNRDSGLLGVSGISGDMRAVLAAAHTDNGRARLAFQLYCYRVRKCVGSFAAVLGGLDDIVFGGGVGEHLAEVRRSILGPLAWLGVELRDSADDSSDRKKDDEPECLVAARSRVGAWVVTVDETAQMSLCMDEVLGASSGASETL